MPRPSIAESRASRNALPATGGETGYKGIGGGTERAVCILWIPYADLTVPFSIPGATPANAIVPKQRGR